MQYRILPTFTAEPSLVGELVKVVRVDSGNMVLAKLLGDSEYIVTHTDGYVYLNADEIESVQ